MPNISKFLFNYFSFRSSMFIPGAKKSQKAKLAPCWQPPVCVGPLTCLTQKTVKHKLKQKSRTVCSHWSSRFPITLKAWSLRACKSVATSPNPSLCRCTLILFYHVEHDHLHTSTLFTCLSTFTPTNTKGPLNNHPLPPVWSTQPRRPPLHITREN